MRRNFPFVLAVVVAGVGVLGAASCDRRTTGRERGDQPRDGQRRQVDLHHGSGNPGGEDPATSPGDGIHADRVLAAYLKVHRALASDSVEGVGEAARELAAAAELHRGHGGPHAEVAGGLLGAAERLGAASTREESRQAFRTLGPPMIAYRALVPAVAGGTVVVHCPMANAEWLQMSTEVQNPYHGSEMPRCGTLTKRRGET